MKPNEIFLSHSSKNKDFNLKLATMLREHGIPVWYSPTDISGAQWHDEIGKALKRCDWFIVLLSSDSIQSKWVKRELLFALQQDRLEARIVPVLYESCDFESLSWVLSGFNIFDFRDSFDEGARKLLKLWGVGYQKQAKE